jgi:hypothetical protein
VKKSLRKRQNKNNILTIKEGELLKNKKLLVVVGILIIGSFFVFDVVLGDVTGTLRPTADGGDDDPNWVNTAATGCDATDCYTEVNEETCDGDTSYIDNETRDFHQTFDIDESSIPDGSTVTQITVSICHKRISGSGGKFQTRYCHNGTCENSGLNITAASMYTIESQVFATNFVKSAGSDIEIGVTSTDNAGKIISQIYVVITYTAPAPTPTLTPTPTPGPGDAVIEVISGGGNTPARIIFNGEIFPEASVTLFLMGEEYGQIQIDDTFVIGDDGKFLIEAISPVEEERFYALFPKDADGIPMKSKFYQYDLSFNIIVRQKDIIFAPSININKARFARNEIMLIAGYAAPGNTVELIVDGEPVKTIDVERGGLYRIDVNTDDLTLGIHEIQARQIDDETGNESNNSPIKVVNISLIDTSNCDLNMDAEISVSDWSIFLLSWLGGTEETKVRADLNGDGVMGIEDFSLFLQCWRLNN